MIAQLLFSGLALGAMYALVALGYNITYATSQTVNFSQGQSVMVGAVVAYAFHVGLGWPFWAALLTGSCEIKESPETSAVLAVLDATNRWIERAE